MKKLLDTTFLVHHLRGQDRVKQYLEHHDGPGTEFITSTIAMKELAVGFHRVQTNPTFADVYREFRWLDIVPFSAQHAFQAASIEASLREQGLTQAQVGAMAGDILIGAVAVGEGATVVTENLGDFEVMSNVNAESY